MGPALGCLLLLLPVGSASLHVCLCFPAPCIPGTPPPPPLSLPLWIPCQSLLGDIAGRLPRSGHSNPTFFSWCVRPLVPDL